MSQVVTVEEERGEAEQLDLPLISREDKISALVLRDELDLISPVELARALGLAEQTLATWRSDKTGPAFVKLGKSVFYRREDLKHWILACKTGLVPTWGPAAGQALKDVRVTPEGNARGGVVGYDFGQTPTSTVRG